MAGTIVNNPVVQFFDNNGNPLAGGKITTYLSNTVTPAATYQNEALSTLNTNPIILNSRGEATIWLTPDVQYTFVLTDADDNLIQTVNDIYGAFQVGSNVINASNVTYISTGSGAVPISQEDWNDQWITVKDFGAVGDGVTDDTAAIQAALNTGKSVYLPDGIYKISAALAPVGSQSLRGNSVQGCVINQSVASESGIVLTSKQFVYLSDFTINGAPASTAVGIQIIGGGSNAIEDVLITAFNDGLDVASTTPFRATEIRSVDCLRHGIRVRSNGSACVDPEFTNCRSDGHGANAWSIEGLVSGMFVTMAHANLSQDGLNVSSNADGQPAYLFFSQFIADSNSRNGISLGTCNTIEFNNCWSSNRGSGSNWLIGPTAFDVRLLGGKVFNCNGHGITVQGNRTTIVGTSIEDVGIDAANTFDGINVQSAFNSFTGVKVTSGANTTRFGIRMGLGSSNNTVTGGSGVGNVSGAYSDVSGGLLNTVVNFAGAIQENWTPFVDFESGQVGSFTYTTQYGRSSRIGNRIFCDFNIVWTAAPTAGSVFRIGGFPISVGDNNSVNGLIAFASGITYTPNSGAGPGSSIAVNGYTNDRVALFVNASGAAYADPRLAGTGLAASGSIKGTFSYLI